jgi:endoglucanase
LIVRTASPIPTISPTPEPILSHIIGPPIYFLLRENPEIYYYQDFRISERGSLVIVAFGFFLTFLGITMLTTKKVFKDINNNPIGIKNYFGLLLLLLGVGTVVGVFYLNSPLRNKTQVYSPYTLTVSSWDSYKKKYITDEGRVIDHSLGDITTSEGQSYALLTAVWVDDKETFDRVLEWTMNNLKRDGDQLFGWRWGKKDDGSYGFVEVGGENSASDADSDIALALILASRRWNEKNYLDTAVNILNDLWNINTTEVAGKRYLIAGNWAQSDDRVIINPSYFSPYAWRIFAEVNTNNNWESLITPAYELLRNSGQDSLDKGVSVGLPPDWLALDRSTGKLNSPQIEGLTTNYSFDAMRIPWRVGLDYLWNNSPEAKAYLESLSYLSNYYQQFGKLPTNITHDGQVTDELENPGMYATSLIYFSVIDPDVAKQVYEEKILRLYSNDQNSFRDDIPYYESNWLWFGSTLYLNRLNKF